MAFVRFFLLQLQIAFEDLKRMREAKIYGLPVVRWLRAHA